MRGDGGAPSEFPASSQSTWSHAHAGLATYCDFLPEARAALHMSYVIAVMASIRLSALLRRKSELCLLWLLAIASMQGTILLIAR